MRRLQPTTSLVWHRLELGFPSFGSMMLRKVVYFGPCMRLAGNANVFTATPLVGPTIAVEIMTAFCESGLKQDSSSFTVCFFLSFSFFISFFFFHTHSPPPLPPFFSYFNFCLCCPLPLEVFCCIHFQFAGLLASSGLSVACSSLVPYSLHYHYACRKFSMHRDKHVCRWVGY